MEQKRDSKARKTSLLAEIASMYYEQDMTQNEIADRVCISRTRISRLLKQAKEQNIVTVTINYTGERAYELEDILLRRFHLKNVRVFNSRNTPYEKAIQGMGVVAAEFFEESLREKQIVGITWGKGVNATINELKGNKSIHPVVVQLMGATAIENPVIDVPGLIRKVIDLYDGTGYYLNAPLYVEDDYVRDALKEQPLISETLDKAKKANIVLTGIGNISSETFSYVWKGFDTEYLIKVMKERHAVGSVCSQAYDIQGKPLNEGLNERIMGISLNELCNIETVIGVAGGKNKSRSVLGALRGQYVNVLITDSACATEVLHLCDMEC